MRSLIAAVVSLSFMAYATSTAARAQALSYSATVNIPSCAGSVQCIFSFPSVPQGILTVSRVTCRIITPLQLNGVPGQIIYAILGKSTNLTKFEFLVPQQVNYGMFPNTAINWIDANTQIFVQAGGSPVINIITSINITAPNPGLDQPTCTVSGLIQ